MNLLKVTILVIIWNSALADSEMAEFYPGQEAFLDSKSELNSFAVVFEDDSTTAYFYALDTSSEEQMILDAMHIYNADNVTDSDKSSMASLSSLRSNYCQNRCQRSWKSEPNSILLLKRVATLSFHR